MKRRHFLQQASLGATAMMATPFTRAQPSPVAESPFHLNYGFHEGMFASHAGDRLVDQIRFGYDQGFQSIEDNGMMDRTPQQQQEIGDTLAKLGMQMGVFVVAFDHWPLQTSLTSGDASWQEKFLQTCRQAVEVAKRCNATYMTVVPGNYERSLSMSYQTANVLESLKRASAIFEPHQLVMVLEPLSDTPDLFLRYSDQAFALCKAVDSPSCKILFDIYHMQRNEGDILRHIDEAWEEIAYFQVGDNPGRKEPGTGELNYRNIFKHLYEKGYKGVVGMEHGIAGKGKAGEEALIKAYRAADGF